MRPPAPLRRQLPPPAPALPPAGPGASLFQWALPAGRRCRALAGAGAAGEEKRAAPAGQAGFNARLTGGAFQGWGPRAAGFAAQPRSPPGRVFQGPSRLRVVTRRAAAALCTRFPALCTRFPRLPEPGGWSRGRASLCVVPRPVPFPRPRAVPGSAAVPSRAFGTSCSWRPRGRKSPAVGCLPLSRTLMLLCGFFPTAGISQVFICGELLDANTKMKRSRVNTKQWLPTDCSQCCSWIPF